MQVRFYNHWLKLEYRMDISAVADPPVATRMRLDAMSLFRSLHRTSILVVCFSFASSIRLRSRPNCFNVGAKVTDLISKGFRHDVDDCRKILELTAEGYKQDHQGARFSSAEY